MMIPGRSYQGSNGDWVAIVDLLSCYSQGKTKEQAFETLGYMIRGMASEDESNPDLRFKIGITDDGPNLFVTSNDSARLAAVLLRHQRQYHQMTLDDVRKKLKLKSSSTYAQYEKGTVEPTLSRMLELLAVVAPELVLSVVPRGPTMQMKQKPMRVKARRGPKPKPKRRKAA